MTTHQEPDGPLAALLDEDSADLYDHAPCGYLSVNEAGLVLKVNATFLAWTGYRREDLVGIRQFSELLTVGGRIFYETHLRPLLAMQGFVREIALDLSVADGRTIPILINAARRHLPDHHGPGVIRITVFDATERRRYERELLAAREEAERAAQSRTELINMVSHDVRAPLGAVLTAAALLEKSSLSPAQVRFVEIIHRSTVHAVSLMNSILELNKLEAGRSPLNERPFDIRQLLGGLVASAALQASKKPGLHVDLTVDEKLPETLMGDRQKIAQIITNLLTNAVKFCERGTVSVVASEVAREPGYVTVEFVVSDTGIGIPADRLPHIFEEFTQGSDEIAERYGGAGFGLAIARKLLRLYGSEMTVTSVVGQGSTFAFRLRLGHE